MEDIAGARQGDQIAACTPDVAAAVLEGMAGLHAPCWESPELARLEWLNRNTSESSEFLATMVQSLVPGFLERYADQLSPEHQEVCRVYAENVPAYVSLRASGPRTATHGDFRLDNFLFEPNDPEPVVVDWQTAVWSGAAYDVAYFIGGCLTTQDRRAHQDALLAHYHAALCRLGVRDYSLDQLRADVRVESFGGILMAIVASMVVERTDRGDLMFLTSTMRHAQHAIDEDAPALLLAAR
jgi:Ser/Thr protein kinase RdoA (MazF antagonist)